MADLCPWKRKHVAYPKAWRLYFWLAGYLEGNAAADGDTGSLVDQAALDDMLEALCDAEEAFVVESWGQPVSFTCRDKDDPMTLRLNGEALGVVQPAGDARAVVADVVILLNQALTRRQDVERD